MNSDRQWGNGEKIASYLHDIIKNLLLIMSAVGFPFPFFA